MLKQPKASKYATPLKLLFVGETALFIVIVYYYHNMNKSRDYRKFMFEKHRWALNAYYYLEEKGGYRTREFDYHAWGMEKVKDGSS